MPDFVDEGQQLRRDGREFCDHGRRRDSGSQDHDAAHCDAPAGDRPWAERAEVLEVLRADRAAAVLVFVSRPDAAPRGADAAVAERLLPQWSSSRCSGRMSVAFSAMRRFLAVTATPCASMRAISSISAHGSTNDAVADHRQLARTHDARRQQRELERLVADDERMAGVVTALKRTTTSARWESQSTILPLPSSPHWAPTNHYVRHVPFLRGVGPGSMSTAGAPYSRPQRPRTAPKDLSPPLLLRAAVVEMACARAEGRSGGLRNPPLTRICQHGLLSQARGWRRGARSHGPSVRISGRHCHRDRLHRV